MYLEGFPGGSDGKESACNAGDSGLIPGLGRSAGEENGNPLQYFCLENSLDRGAWQATIHGVIRIRHHLVTTPSHAYCGASLVSQMVKNLPAMQETLVQSLGQEDPLEQRMDTHSSILAWRIPWTWKSHGLQSIGSQTV